MSNTEESNRPLVSLEEAREIVEGKTAPRVTKEHIEDKIKGVQYLAVTTLTICVITMHNGFRVVGKAAPADPANYDPMVGERYAYEDAFKQLWHLEGYLLCEDLHRATVSKDPQ